MNFRRSEQGSVSFEVFVAILVVGLVVFSFFLMNLPKKSAVDPKEKPEDAKLATLDDDIYHLYLSLSDIETMRNSRKYMRIVGDAEKKIIQSDYLWEKKNKSGQGSLSGMAAGLNENYEARFTTTEKFHMLSSKYGLPARQLRRLKADLEIMFMQEYADKYGATDDDAKDKDDKSTDDKSTQDAAGNGSDSGSPDAAAPSQTKN